MNGPTRRRQEHGSLLAAACIIIVIVIVVLWLIFGGGGRRSRPSTASNTTTVAAAPALAPAVAPDPVVVPAPEPVVTEAPAPTQGNLVTAPADHTGNLVGNPADTAPVDPASAPVDPASVPIDPAVGPSDLGANPDGSVPLPPALTFQDELTPEQFLDGLFDGARDTRSQLYIPGYAYVQGAVASGMSGDVTVVGPVRVIGGTTAGGSSKLEEGAMVTTAPEYLDGRVTPSRHRFQVVQWKESD